MEEKNNCFSLSDFYSDFNSKTQNNFNGTNIYDQSEDKKLEGN